MVDFVVPPLGQSVRDLELGDGDAGHLRVMSPRELGQASAAEQEGLVQALAEVLADAYDPADVIACDQSWFDGLYSLVRFMEDLSPRARAATADLVRDALQRLSAAIQSRALQPRGSAGEEATNLLAAFKAMTYFGAKLCIDEERRSATVAQAAASSKSRAPSGVAGYKWSEHRLAMLDTLLASIKGPQTGDASAACRGKDITWLWDGTVPEETFLDLYWRTAEALVLENSKLLADAGLAETLADLICAPVHQFYGTVSHLVVASFSHSMRKDESVVRFVCNVLRRLHVVYKDDRLAQELILEVGRVDTSTAARDNHGAKSLGVFLELFAQEVPALAVANLSVLVPHLNAQAYPLRCAVLRALGLVITHLKGAAEQPADLADDSDDESDEEEDSSSIERVRTRATDSASTRDRLLDLVGERGHDSSSYVRAVAVGVLGELAGSSSLPLSHIHVACDIARERLLDKSSLVRKQAIATLTALLENNPYAGQLNPAVFSAKIEQLRKTRGEQQTKSADDASPGPEDSQRRDSIESDGAGQGSDLDQTDQESAVDMDQSGAGEGDDGSDDGRSEQDGDGEQSNAFELQYLKGALGFAMRMELSCAQAQQLIMSKSVTDVLESMRFLSCAVRFQLPAAQGSMRKMLALIWDDRESGRVKKELLETFELLFISEPIQVGRSTKRKVYSEQTIAAKLIDLVSGSSLSELTSLEAIIGELVSEDGTLKRLIMPTAVVERIFEQALELAVGDGASVARARAAMCLFAMICTSSRTLFDRKPSSVPRLVDRLQSMVADFGYARFGLQALGQVLEGRGAEFGDILEHLVIQIVSNKPADAEDDASRRQWYPAVEQGLRLLAKSCARPDLTLARVLRRAHAECFGDSSGIREDGLARLLFVAGHVAIHMFVYAERVSVAVKKHRKGEEDRGAQVKQSKAEEEEQTMLGGGEEASDDFEEAMLRKIAEEEILSLKDNSLLGRYVSIAVQVVRRGLAADRRTEEDTMPLSVDLMESATLALCKFMCVSNTVCEQHLRLLLTVLRDSSDPMVRSNIMVALGDLAVRFPNTIEPFTSQVYRRLRDSDVGVRTTALMCLSHLILNDMLKVRGEVSEIALCVEDESSERIRDLACLFFHEMSRKGSNPVYNLLPDTLNKLSKDPLVDSDKFSKLAPFLMQFITLEKHVLSISDKLCQRIFAATGLTAGADEVESVEAVENIKLCRDLALCLSHLKFSDRALVKLADDAQFKLYKPVLADTAVYECFENILKKGRQSAKAETKELLEEWAARMDKVREAHMANHATTQKAKKSLRKTGKAVPAARSARPRRVVASARV